MVLLAHQNQPPNGISIGSAVFAYTAAETLHAFLWGGQPPKLPLFPCGIWTQSNTWFLWPTLISPQMASGSVQPCLRRSRTWPTHTHTQTYRQTDHAT